MKRILSEMRSVLQKSWLWTLVHALLLTIVTYLMWNIPYDLTDGGSFLQKFNLLKSRVETECDTPDSLLLINTSYERQLVPVKDELGDSCGVIDIADRHKLLKLMQALDRESDYSYIMCDISFSTEYRTDVDDSLYTLMASMPRIVVAQLSTASLPAKLKPLAASSEYGISIQNNNFLKYQYIQHGQPSVALRMAMDRDSIRLHKFGPFYFCNGMPCNNCHVVNIGLQVSSAYSDEGVKNIKQMGTDVLNEIDMGQKGLFTDKIILIGDFMEHDVHTTVAGELSGPVITYNAYLALQQHQNNVSLLLLFAIFLVYALLIWLIHIESIHLQTWTTRLRYLLMSIVVLLFLWTGTYVDALFMFAYFTFYRYVRRAYHYIKEKKLKRSKESKETKNSKESKKSEETKYKQESKKSEDNND